MRRLIVIGSLFIVMMSILSGCTLDSSSSSPRSSSPVASTVNNSSETYPEVEPTEPILYHDLKMLTSSMGIGTTCNTKTGFYELDLSGALPTLFYIDYATHQKLPLCSRPECQHNDETCNAVIPNAIGVVNFQQHLLVFCSAIEGNPSILQIGYDGNDRVTPVELNSADRYDRAFAGDQNVLFTIVEAYSSELNVQTPQLIQIDLAQGSIQKLTQLDSSKSWFLVGTADNTLILKSIEVTQNKNPGSHEAYLSQKHELFFYDLQLQEMTPQRSWMQEEVVDASYGDYLFFYIPSKGTFEVNRFDGAGLTTVLQSQPIPIPDSSSLYFLGLYDDRLVVQVGEKIESESSGSAANVKWRQFAVDISDGSVIELHLSYTYAGVTDFVVPVAESDGVLLVKCGVQEKMMTAEGPDGTIQQYPTVVPVYATISSTNYFSNNAQYTKIQ